MNDIKITLTHEQALSFLPIIEADVNKQTSNMEQFIYKSLLTEIYVLLLKKTLFHYDGEKNYKLSPALGAAWYMWFNELRTKTNNGYMLATASMATLEIGKQIINLPNGK